MEIKRWTLVFVAAATIAVTSCSPSGTTKDEKTINVETEILSLPDGFSPDGITIAKDGTIYMASIYDGKIVKGRVDGTEIANVLVKGEAERGAFGMDLDIGDNYLFVAGGFSKTARIYDAKSGALNAEIQLASSGIVNDVIVTSDAAYFTNSSLPEVYEIPIDRNGKVNGKARVIPLTGEFQFDAEYFSNGNGIEYAGNNTLIVNHSFLGKMYAINVETGIATDIDLGGDSVSSDGIALDGLTLYGTEPPKNLVAELELSSDLSEAKVVRRISSEIFDFPTLIAVDEEFVYVVNGKLSTKRGPAVPYEVIRLPR